MLVEHLKYNQGTQKTELHAIDIDKGYHETWNDHTKSYDITPDDRLSESQIKAIEASRRRVEEKVGAGLAKSAVGYGTKEN